jgi:DNA-binding NarL/FixJ family response regulator
MTSIYIISKLPMFGEGIEKMLRSKEGVEILGFEEDIARAIKQIIELKPEIVVFDCKEDQAEISSAIMQILEKGMKVKIVGSIGGDRIEGGPMNHDLAEQLSEKTKGCGW